MADVLTPGFVISSRSNVLSTGAERSMEMKMGDLRHVVDPKPIEIPLECEYVVIIGANEVAYTLALELHERGWSPLLLGTQEIINSYWCNELRADEQLQKQQQLRDKLDEVKVKTIANNFVQDVEHSHTKHAQLFRIKTLQNSSLQTFISMTVVLCSEAEIRKYKNGVTKFLGFYVCDKVQDIAETVESLSFRLQFVTEDIRSRLVESASINEDDVVKLVPPKETTKKPFCCC